METTIRFNLNTVECKIFQKFENGRMVSYGYSIERDRNGLEVNRTAPFAISSIGWDDGTPFTESDRNNIVGNNKKLQTYALTGWLSKQWCKFKKWAYRGSYWY